MKKGKKGGKKEMSEKMELSIIRSRLDELTDNIDDSMGEIKEYVAEMRELLVKSGERL